jgi:hypothetical protein
MTQLTMTTAFTIADSVVFRELDGESVLLNLDSGQYFGLNAVGTRIWQLISELGQPQAVLDAMVTEFEVTPAELETDMLDLLEQLAAHGLVAAVP